MKFKMLVCEKISGIPAFPDYHSYTTVIQHYTSLLDVIMYVITDKLHVHNRFSY